MIVIRFWMACCFLLMSGAVLAVIDASNPGEQNSRVVITRDAGAKLHLEARQAPMAQVLDSIAGTGVRINYSVLPDGLVTTTCVGPTAKQLMECLLAHRADIVFRYSRRLSKVGPQWQPVEAWVLGVESGAEQSSPVAESSADISQQALPTATGTNNESEPDETDELVKMASSKIPEERAEAIGRLMAGGRKDDIIVKKTLEAALLDLDARVRVKAISSYAYREGPRAGAALHAAMLDSEASVRLTAVDRAGADAALLQQALTDSDATVRQLAAIRLKSLSKPNGFQ
jgi:hypothetical protein